MGVVKNITATKWPKQGSYLGKSVRALENAYARIDLLERAIREATSGRSSIAYDVLTKALRAGSDEEPAVRFEREMAYVDGYRDGAAYAVREVERILAARTGDAAPEKIR